MRKGKKVAIALLSTLLGLPIAIAVVLLAVGAYLYYTADFLAPAVEVDMARYGLTTDSDSLRTNHFGSLRLNKYGLWEATLRGDAVDRGGAYGVLTKELLDYQEDAFIEQMNRIVPSPRKIKRLHKLIILFNRNMAKHIPSQYREEIYAMAQSAAEEYNIYGTPYVRQLNYHAAHDIGHTMQQYMLVGCSSFATWESESSDGKLLIGRNFDFYVGDNFAKNKMVLFVEPKSGYRFVSICWPGMLGVVSGMNEHGLTITINASKGAMPTSSAMPISLLARHILQYASTISEAYELAGEFQTFVSESLLIGSAKDGCAAIIEKSPEQIALFRSDSKRIVCTNHYQSELFATNEYNIENIATSDSPYRHRRINELLDSLTPIDPTDAAAILRNRYGDGGKDIGVGNEKSVNQFIAHHSVLFSPEELKVWVSTAPWQLGEYICYDLNTVFGSNADGCLVSKGFNIPADKEMISTDYPTICRHREQYMAICAAIESGSEVSEQYITDFIANNPNYYQVYNITGDYMLLKKGGKVAAEYWQKALSLEIPRRQEREKIANKVERYDKK